MALQEPSRKLSTQPSPENPGRKRPVSERRIQANRRNALRSTGPKTAQGKRTVARNAIKHGFLAREVVITAGDGEEDMEEFHALVERLWESYEPVGVVEESLVQTIATCLWRKARVIRAENGEIRKRLDSAKVDRYLQNSDKITLDLTSLELLSSTEWDDADTPAEQRPSIMSRLAALLECQLNVRNNREGLEYLSALLSQAKSELASKGHISADIQRPLFQLFGLWDYLFVYTCLSEGRAITGVDCRKNKRLTEALDRQQEKIGLLKQLALEGEKLEGDAEARSFSLPPADATDKLLRYEAHLDRQLYRAMDQLERLQRQRKGEKVPPPLHINLGRRG